MSTVRIGLIGSGKHGSRYAQHVVADLSHTARLVALCRRDAAAGQAAARQYGCRYTPEIGEVLAADDVDAVVVAVPPTLHADICETAAAAGKAILLEKPMAPTLAEAERIRAALADHPVPFMVAQTLRFNTVVCALRRCVDDIAPLQSIYLSQRFEPSRLPWLDRRHVSGGGIVIHTGVHSFDLLRFLTGAEAESAWCRTWQAFTKETEDNFVAQITLEGSIEATVIGSRSTQGRNGLIEIVGERGQLVGDHSLHFAYQIHGRTRTALQLGPAVPTVCHTLGAFVHAVSSGTPPPIGWQDGRAAVAMAEACYRSAESGGLARIAHGLS